MSDPSKQTVQVAHVEEQKNAGRTENVFQVDQNRKGQNFMDSPTYGKPEKDGVTLEEVQQEISGKDAVQQKNEMLFASQTTSAQDAQKLEEDGYSLLDTEIETVVTETDKIKMVLAKAGCDISCFGDGLTTAQISEMAGTEALASQLAQILEQADLPATEENISDLMDTISILGELSPVSDGSIRYMLQNGLEATPENLFKAQFSGSQANAVYKQQGQIDYAALQPDIERTLAEASLEPDQKNVEDARWLLANEIPLTAENLIRKQELEQLEMPMDGQKLMQIMTQSMAEGVRPQKAVLTDEVLSPEEMARNVLDSIANEPEKSNDNAYRMVKAMRQLEETRLIMSKEANLTLMKSGISIDTTELENLVEELKQREAELRPEEMVSGEADLVQQKDTWDLMQEVEYIKSLPAYAIGMVPAEELTLNRLKEQGSVLQVQMEQAGQRYETMQTQPRQDLGDQMQKAFRNVDDLLREIGMEPNSTNQRAVRILAYNQMEITPENVQRMKAADEMVQRSFSNLKPAVVETMIKREINPLDMDLNSLNMVAEEIQSQQGISEEEAFSKYLYKLEQNRQISEEQRSAYIGIYRLIRQVENTDGAAIGSLLQQGGEMTLRNLLTQVRISKHKNMDYQVDDDFGGVSAAEGNGQSITDQIEQAYQQNLWKDIRDALTPEKMRQLGTEEQWMEMTPEEMARRLQEMEESTDTEHSYQSRQLEDLAQAAAAPEEVYRLLDHYDLPVTVSNVMAAMQQYSQRNRVFQQIFGGGSEDMSQELREIQEQLLKDFGEAVKTPEEMAEAQERLAETAENVMKDMILEKENVTSIDVRDMKIAMSQITLMGEQAREEQYAVPVLVQGELCNVSLKIVRGEDKKGLVDILFDTDRLGKVAATLQATANGVSAYFAVEREETGKLFAGSEEAFQKLLGDTDRQEFHMNMAVSENLDLNTFGREHHNPFRYGDTEEDPVQTRTLYRMAESFLNVVKSLERETDIQNS